MNVYKNINYTQCEENLMNQSYFLQNLNFPLLDKSK